VAERFLGGVGEHHAEAERFFESVALVHRDVVARVRLLEQQGEEQPRRTAADGDRLHARASR
jgi:hypothetical protein